jgi:hypothetical protein
MKSAKGTHSMQRTTLEYAVQRAKVAQLLRKKVTVTSSSTRIFKKMIDTCPELVRVENGLKWHNTYSISTEVPRVVHPEDVRTRKMHVVVGRKKCM